MFASGNWGGADFFLENTINNLNFGILYNGLILFLLIILINHKQNRTYFLNLIIAIFMCISCFMQILLDLIYHE